MPTGSGSGRVGIGTSNPLDKLEVLTTDGWGITHTNGTVRMGSYIGSGGGWLATKSNSPLYFATALGNPNCCAQMTLNTNGSLGIGYLNPIAGYKLSANGGAYINGPILTTGDVEVLGDLLVTQPNRFVSADYFKTDSWIINGVNDFFFISGPNTQFELHDGGSDVYSTSDKNNKKDIKPMPSLLEKVKALQPTQYYYKSDTLNSNLSSGFIAQDVQKLFPYVVHTRRDPDGTSSLSLSYRQFSVIAIKAIQEQQLIIEQQQVKIDLIEKRLTSIEEILNNNSRK